MVCASIPVKSYIARIFFKKVSKTSEANSYLNVYTIYLIKWNLEILKYGTVLFFVKTFKKNEQR